MWVAEGEDFPHALEAKRNECLSASEMFDYLVEYAAKFGLDKLTKLSSRVVRVCYDSRTDQSQVEIMRPSGELEMFGSYDAVIYASFNPTPNVPTWPKQQEFQGRVIHTSEFQTPVFEQIQQSNARVVVVGGSKSAIDALTSFGRAGHKNVTWLRRSAYVFIKYHTICHDRSCYAMARAFFAIGGLTLALLWPPLCPLFLMIINCAVVPRGFTLNIWRFHFGFLSEEHIQRANEATLIKSEIDHFTPTGAVLRTGEELKCDYVICATGYRTGVSNIVYEVDNHSVAFQPVESLFEGVCSPVMPRMMFANAIAYAFGMKRATGLADHVMSILVRYPDPSRIKNTFFNSRSSNMQAGFNFDTAKPLTIVFLTTWLLLIYVGVLSIPSLLSHFIGLFMLCRLRALNLKHPKTTAPSVA